MQLRPLLHETRRKRGGQRQEGCCSGWAPRWLPSKTCRRRLGKPAPATVSQCQLQRHRGAAQQPGPAPGLPSQRCPAARVPPQRPAAVSQSPRTRCLGPAPCHAFPGSRRPAARRRWWESGRPARPAGSRSCMGREEGEDRSGAVRGAPARGGCQTSHRPRWLAPLEHVSNSWLRPALQLFCVHLLAHAACTCPAGSSPGDSPLVTRQPHIHPPDAAEGCRQLGGCDRAAALASQVCRRRRECRLRSGMRVGVREGHGMWGSELAQCPCANAADQFAVTTQACKTCHPCRPPSAGHSSCCCGQRGMRAWQRRQAAAHVCIVGSKGVQREVEVFAGPAEAGAAAPSGVPLRPRLAVPIRPCTVGEHRRPPHARCVPTATRRAAALAEQARRHAGLLCTRRNGWPHPHSHLHTHTQTHTHTHALQGPHH